MKKKVHTYNNNMQHVSSVYILTDKLLQEHIEILEKEKIELAQQASFTPVGGAPPPAPPPPPFAGGGPPPPPPPPPPPGGVPPPPPPPGGTHT